MRPGAPEPEIRDEATLRAAVEQADAVVFNRASTGQYMDRLFERLGLTAVVAPKARRYGTGAEVMEHLLHGTGREIGFGAITEILLFRDRGIRYVGPLPPALQTFTVYAAALPASGSRGEAARQLLDHLRQPATRAMLADAGVDPAP